jgi:hypothetical protein
MSLTRIDPSDFVFSNDSISTSCWRDANGNPVGDTSTTPTFLNQTITYPGGNIRNSYLGSGVQANSQFTSVNVDKNAADDSILRQAYGAIRNIVYGDKNAIFEWGGSEKTQFTVRSISKNLIGSSLLPGSLRLNDLTDDSNLNPPAILNCGRVYKIVEASSTTPFSFGRGTVERGLFLPDVGLIINEGPGPSAFQSITNFSLRNLNPTPTNHVFIRARNTQYNYSMNPSFISGSSGKIINQDWFDNPQTYITTVGLYNDNNELMATAKLPRPYNKNFNNELLMQIGLNF